MKTLQPFTVQNIGGMQHVFPMMYYNSPGEPTKYDVKTEKDTVGINTYNSGTNTFSQTDNIRQNRGSQTHPIQLVVFGVNTN